MAPGWPSDPAQLLALDLDGRAAWLLRRLADAPLNEKGENFARERLAEWYPDIASIGPITIGPGGTTPERRAENDRVKRAIDEAYGALMARGLIIPDPDAGGSFCRLTALGEEQARNAGGPDQQRVAFAQRALGIELHPALRARSVDAHFRQGKFETALRESATFLEDAIRTLSGLPATTVGVTLADQAFGKSGQLADPNDPSGQQTGLQNLFKGFFGAVRNLLAHTEFRYADPKEAFDLLMFVDYLTGKLDVAARRIGKTLP